MTVRVAGEAWGMPLLDQKTKALITIAIDKMALNVNGEGNPFGADVDMALKQGYYNQMNQSDYSVSRTIAWPNFRPP